MKLTVIIRDDGPMIHCGDCPSYRTVVINLTEDQAAQIELRETHRIGTTTFRENISHVILEDSDTPQEGRRK